MWYHDSRREGGKLEMNKKGELLCDSQTEKVTTSTSKSMFQTPTLNYRLCSVVINAKAGLYTSCFRASYLYLSRGSL